MKTTFARTTYFSTAALLAIVPTSSLASEVPGFCADAAPLEDCRLDYDAANYLTIIFDYAEDGASVSISQGDLDAWETIGEAGDVDLGDVSFPPFLRDIDGDGTPEIFVDTGSHDAQIMYFVYALEEATGLYQLYQEYWSFSRPQDLTVSDGMLIDRNFFDESTYFHSASLMGAQNFEPAYSAKVDPSTGTCSEVQINVPGKDFGLTEESAMAHCVANIDFEYFGVHSDMDGMAWCDSLEPGDGGVDCALNAGQVFLEFVYGDDSVTITQFMDGEELGAAETLALDGPMWSPSLKDIGDETFMEQVVLVPVSSGRVNTDFSVWSANDVDYAPKGMLTAASADAVEAQDGMLVAWSRTSARSYETRAVAVTSHGLETVYTLVQDFESGPDSYCSIYTSDFFAAKGLDEAVLLAECEASAKEALE